MQSPFAGPTATTGYVTLDSDGITATIADPHISELTTPAIDCSAQSVVYFAFNAHIGVYDLSAEANALLKVSTDGGMTWVDYTLFPGQTGGAVGGEARWSENPMEVVVNLTDQCAGESAVLLKWHWTAGWEYFWNIDDVILTSENPIDPHDMRVNSNFFAVAPNFKTPASQVETFGFLADIENVGSADQTGVALNVTVVDNADPGTNLYDQTLDYGLVEADSLKENELFPDAGFTPASTPAIYTGTYTVAADSTDSDLSNNTQTFTFEVTEDLWQKDSGLENAGAFSPLEDQWEGTDEAYSWAWGNHFHVVNDGYFATETHFALGNPEVIVDQQVIVKLYSWSDDNADGSADPAERTWEGFATHTVTSGDVAGELISEPLLNINDNLPGVALSAGVDYILMLEFSATDQTVTTFMATQDLDYGAAVFRSELLGVPRYGNMFGASDPLSLESFDSGGRDTAPVVRMTVGDERPILESTTSVLDDNNIVKVYPSPATDFINVDVDLAEIQEEVIVEIVDVTGKVIAAQSRKNLQKDVLFFDVSKMSIGNYFINVTTPEGQKTTKFSIQK